MKDLQTDTDRSNQNPVSDKRTDKGKQAWGAHSTSMDPEDIQHAQSGEEQELSKGSLPDLSDPNLDNDSKERLTRAWVTQLEKGFSYNETMFRRVLSAFMVPYWMTIIMYGILFIVGIGLFLTAVTMSWWTGNILFGVLFGGLGVATFLAYFISQPLRALEENLEFITWLGGTYNSYWAKLLEIRKNETALAELRTVANEFDLSMERLITKHAEMRGKRPVSSPSATQVLTPEPSTSSIQSTPPTKPDQPTQPQG